MNSRKILCSIGIGAIAGIIDVVPMMIQGLDIYSDVSAFVFWLVMGFIISNVSLPIKNWLKGTIIALASAIPIIVLVSAGGFLSAVPIIAMTLILGSLVGYFTGKYCK